MELHGLVTGSRERFAALGSWEIYNPMDAHGLGNGMAWGRVNTNNLSMFVQYFFNDGMSAIPENSRTGYKHLLKACELIY